MIKTKYITEQYQLVKVLGKGNFGKVYLTVKDGVCYTMKQKSKIKLKQENLISNFDQQLQIIKTLKSDHILELITIQQDQKSKYLIYEYCNVGNLYFYQGRFPQQIVPVEKVFLIVSHIIKGLQHLHKLGHLHLNLKPQNLIFNYARNQQTVKLMDFLFIRKKDQQIVKPPSFDIERYKAPQQFLQQKCHYGTDMWALGVITFYMLNGEYPFNIRKHLYIKEVKKKCIPSFSYEQAIQRSGKKLFHNCSPEIEDFFKRIFEFQPQRRINFHEIKQHPLLKKYFDPISTYEISRKLYESKFDQKQNKLTINRGDLLTIQLNELPEQSYMRRIVRQHQAATDQIQFFVDQKQFFFDMSELFRLQNQYLTEEIKVCLRYNLLKLYLVESKKLRDLLEKRKLPKDCNMNLKWDLFLLSSAFQRVLTSLKNTINLAELKFKECYIECYKIKNKIELLVPNFMISFNQIIHESCFEDYKIAFRATTTYANKYLSQFEKKNKINDIEFTVLRVKVLLCHVLNKVFMKNELRNNFEIYFGWKLNQKQEIQQDTDQFYFESFKKWLSRENKMNLIHTINIIWKNYFS